MISYGGREELVRAAQLLAERVRAGDMEPDQIDDDALASVLFTRDLPNPDLLIRTSGEYRISNFMLWQLAYTELHITDVLWPDFTRDHLFDALSITIDANVGSAESKRHERTIGRSVVNELGRRVAVAVIAIPAVLGLAWVGGWVLAVPLAAFAFLGSGECHRLASHGGVKTLLWISALAAPALVLLAAWQPSFETFAPWALALMAVLVPGSFLAVLKVRGVDDRPFATVGVTLGTTLYLGLALAFAQLLRALPESVGWAGSSPEAAGLAALTLPLAATWVGDASAYFAGSAWGKAKLAPTISPNKSWVGFWAALVGGGVAAAVWAWVVRDLLPIDELGGVPVLAAVGVLLGAAAVVGDLVESLLKREAGVKDSGTLFPGHGGVLDRVDSLLFTIPLSYGLLSALWWLA